MRVRVTVSVSFWGRFRLRFRVSFRVRVSVRVRKNRTCMNLCKTHLCFSEMIHCCGRYVTL